MTETAAVQEGGFEYQGTFYPWNVSDTGRDLMLIDRITGMPMDEFFETIEDPDQRGRTPILLALIATSISHRHPERSIDRIYRTVMNLSLRDVELVSPEEPDTDEAEVVLPPPPSDESARSPTNGSSLSSTPQDSSSFETSSGTRV
jgi:hypothetical protein